MSLVFDIGANIGSWTKSNINTYDNFITIEASPITFKKLQKNCNHDKVKLLNFAVCKNNNKEIIFYHANCDVLSTINKEWLTNESSRFYNQPFTEIKCKTISIDDLINEYGKPQLIKIDVEGGEYECISSLSHKVDCLCFEWASETNDITFQCLDYLQSLGFMNFYIQNGDNYTFRPNSYHNINECKNKLSKTIQKKDWGMIWCK